MNRLTALLLGAVLLASCGTVAHEEGRQKDVQSVTEDAAKRLGLPEGHDLPHSNAADTRQLLDTIFQSGSLDEAACVRVALLSSPTLRMHFADLGITQADLWQAGLLGNPSIHASWAFFGGGSDLEADLLAPIENLFRMSSKKAMYGARHEAKKADVTAAVIGLVQEVRTAFLHLSTAREALLVEETLAEAFVAVSDLVRILDQAGNTTPEAAARAAAKAAGARLDLSAAQAQVASTEEQLITLLGLFGERAHVRFESAATLDPLANLSLDRIESRVIQNSLALSKERFEINALAQEVGLVTWKGLLPEAIVGGTFRKEPDGARGAGPALELEIPIFDSGSAMQAKVRARLESRFAHYEKVAIEVRSEARRLRDRLTILTDRANYFHETYVPLASALTQRMVERYNAMQVGAQAVLEEKARELIVRRDALMARRDAMATRIALDALLAGLYRGPTEEPILRRSGTSEMSNEKAH